MKLMIYDPQMTLRAARELYFDANDFGPDGGYQERWIKVKIWRIPIRLPNTKGRRQAVFLSLVPLIAVVAAVLLLTWN